MSRRNKGDEKKEREDERMMSRRNKGDEKKERIRRRSVKAKMMTKERERDI